MERDENTFYLNGYPAYKNTRQYCHHERLKKKHGLEKIEKGMEVHHLDANKENYRQDNLILLKEKDHKDLETYMRIIRNENITYSILVGISLFFLTTSAIFNSIWLSSPFWHAFYFLIGTFFLIIAFMISIIPARKLRKILFKTGILRERKEH